MSDRAPDPTPPRDTVSETVRRKADRMRAARRRRPSLFRELAHVGVLGWIFVLPVVALTAVGRVAATTWDQPGLGLVGLGVGLFAGGWATYRAIRRSLEPPPEPPDGDGGQTREVGP